METKKGSASELTAQGEFYEVVIEEKEVTESGKEKKKTETYLCDAIGPTDVEAKMNSAMEGFMLDWQIKSIRKVKVVSVIY